MAQSRKDNKGRVLRKGEHQREKDGKYVYQYFDALGRRKSIYSNDLAKLREREEKLIRDQMDGLDIYVAGHADINFLFDRYLSTKTELRSSTRSGYIYCYDHFVRDTFGKKIIGEVKYSDVLSYYTHLLTKDELTISTVESIHNLLHPSFQLAVRDEIIRFNPSEGALAEIKKKSGKNKGIRHALTLEQQRAFLGYVAESPVFVTWLPFFVFLFGTGCRIGEAVGIRWDDISLDERVIDINHTVTYYARYDKDNKCDFEVSDPKTAAGNRRIPMVDEVFEVLSEEFEEQRENGFSDLVVDGMKGFIFTNCRGGLHKGATVNKAIERIRTHYNAEEEVKAKREHREPVIIPHFSCHHIRHTFCTRFCENETNLKVIQTIMGHADIQTTMDIYAEATELSKRDAVARLSENVKFF